MSQTLGRVPIFQVAICNMRGVQALKVKQS